MGKREIKVPMLVVAALCLFAALAGGTLVVAGGGGQTLGFGLLGFFGAGAYVLGRKALGLD